MTFSRAHIHKSESMGEEEREGEEENGREREGEGRGRRKGLYMAVDFRVVSLMLGFNFMDSI